MQGALPQSRLARQVNLGTEIRSFRAVSDTARILIVEDDPQLLHVVRATLVNQGYETCAAQRGQQALDMIRSEKFALVLLDLNLPDMRGIEVCRAIRSGLDAVIVVLTISDKETDKVAAFDAGADDYVTKPFKVGELLARIRSHLTRRAGTAELSWNLWCLDDAVIDFSRRTVSRKGIEVSLSPKQYQLLRYLVNNRGKAISHRILLQNIWGAEYGEETNLLQAIVAQLRKKIEPDPGAPRYLVSIPWFGYRFDGPIVEMKAPDRSS
jgi:two-component system, OmpR family, KDP operon response regulator KdpE